MAKSTSMFAIMIYGQFMFGGSYADVEKKFDELVDKYVKDGFVKPEVVIRHQQGYAKLMWLVHEKRLNKSKLPLKMSIGIMEGVAL